MAQGARQNSRCQSRFHRIDHDDSRAVHAGKAVVLAQGLELAHATGCVRRPAAHLGASARLRSPLTADKTRVRPALGGGQSWPGPRPTPHQYTGMAFLPAAARLERLPASSKHARIAIDILLPSKI